jgi:hypothetical protein
MAYVIVPTTSSPNQTFRCTLPIDGKNITLAFFLRFNSLAGYWLMDISDPETDLPLLASIPLVPSDAPGGNLLHQYQYLEIGSAAIIKAGATSEEHPGETSLGTDWLLSWGDTR